MSLVLLVWYRLASFYWKKRYEGHHKFIQYHTILGTLWHLVLVWSATMNPLFITLKYMKWTIKEVSVVDKRPKHSGEDSLNILARSHGAFIYMVPGELGQRPNAMTILLHCFSGWYSSATSSKQLTSALTQTGTSKDWQDTVFNGIFSVVIGGTCIKLLYYL